jgi:hypothetical protein
MIKLETYDTRCMYKKTTTGIENHKTNHVYFGIFLDTKFHFQGCYDDDTCQIGSKPCITKLGKIQNENVINTINNWLYPKTIEYCNWSEIK